MRAARPFGQLDAAAILVIGHDPCLQRSQADAEFAFFMDYLTRPRPVLRPEQRKYDLAEAVVSYVSELVGRPAALDELYVTNLCNEFLYHTAGSGIVLIPDDLARRGVVEIEKALATGSFKVILPMAVQPCYHLFRLGFIDEDTDLVRRFVAEARTRASKAVQGIYVQSASAPFLAVCGQKFHHHGVPVAPILHVKQWSRMATQRSLARYRPLMALAKSDVRAIVGLTGGKEHGWEAARPRLTRPAPPSQPGCGEREAGAFGGGPSRT